MACEVENRKDEVEIENTMKKLFNVE